MARKELKDRIKALREKQGIWQAELARRIGSSVNGLAKLEKGEITDPRGSTIIALCEELNVSADYLLGFTDTPTPLPPKPVKKRARKAAPVA